MSYACYTDDLFSIFELDLPWTKSYLALILFTRCYKGFEPYADYWLHDGNETDGSFIVKYLHRCLGDTGKIKSRIRQLVAQDEQGCEADRVLDEMMSETHFSTQLPLSYYECTRLLGTTYLVLGDVNRVFLASSFSFDALEKGSLVKGLKMKKVKEDASGVFVKVKSEGKMTPWDRGELKRRFFVVSDRYLYEWVWLARVTVRYFDGEKKRSALHKQIDLTNLDVNLTEIDETTYIVLSYARTVASLHP